MYSADGDFLFKFGSHGEGNGQFNAPTGVAVDSNGNIIVADWGNSRIQVRSSPRHGCSLEFKTCTSECVSQWCSLCDTQVYAVYLLQQNYPTTICVKGVKCVVLKLNRRQKRHNVMEIAHIFTLNFKLLVICFVRRRRSGQ